MHMQEQSLLLQLPRELREQIWTDVFSNPHLTIQFWDYPTTPTSLRKIFPYTACNPKRPLYHLGKAHDCSQARGCSKFMPNVRHLKSVLAERLGLSLTCWMVYHESIHLLYTKQTFHFPSSIALPALKANLSTSKFHLIRDIKLTFNMADLDSQRGNNRRPKDDIVQNPWRILPFMRGLRVLNVEIQITSQDLVHGTTKGLAQRLSFLLEPAAAVEQVDVFDIRVTDKEFGIAEGFLEVLRNRVREKSVPFRILGEE